MDKNQSPYEARDEGLGESWPCAQYNEPKSLIRATETRNNKKQKKN